MQRGFEGLQIRKFGSDDVDKWARTDVGRRYLAEAVQNSGDYLAAVLPDGRVAGKVGIRYDERPGAGTLFQFDVAEDLRSQGIGTKLVHTAEHRIREYGCNLATLAVEESNEGAIRLYRRLGYTVTGTETLEWDQDAPDGSTYLYQCQCLRMERELAKPE